MTFNEMKISKLSKDYSDIVQQIGNLSSGGKKQAITLFGQGYPDALISGLAGGRTYNNYYISAGKTQNPQLLYGNFTNASDSKDTITGCSTLTIKASIIKGSTIYPITFNGNSQTTLVAGATILSDPLGLTFDDNEEFQVRTFIAVPADTNTHPSGFSAHRGGVGDQTLSASPSWTLFTTPAYSPMAIIGYGNKKAVIGHGDSIQYRSNDSSIDINGKTIYATGFANRACITAKIPYINISKGGEKVQNAIDPTYNWLKHTVLPYGSIFLSDLGTNDCAGGRTFAQIQADLLSLWNNMANRGLKVFATTIPPKTTSTDSWATVENQTPTSSNNVRVQVNDWIRTKPAPLTNYFDVADALESARNSGKWKANYTNDGTHPIAVGHIDMATVVDVSQFV